MTETIQRRIAFKGIKELAEELGVTRQHLHAVLYGRRRPGPELLAKLTGRGIKPMRITTLSRQWN